jgi:ligand-binding sensor domain-containing protein/streptogramin lyase
MVGGDTLWCRVTYNNGLNGVFAYPRGGLEWKRVSDSIEDVTRMVYAGGSLWYLNAGSELRVVDPQAYSARTVLFGGTFLGLSSAKDVQVDQFGRLWFISPQYGAGIYDPAMRRWQTFDTQGGYGLQILRQGSSDEIYVSGASKIYQFVSSVGGITAAGEFPFLNSLSGSQFYAQSNQIWGVQGIGRDYFTISRLTLPVPEKTDASTLWTTQLAHQNSTSQRLKADSALMAGNRIWFLDEAGKAFFFDLASEQWQGLRMDSNQTFSMLSKDPSGNVWAAGENRDVLNSLSWGIYQLVEKDSAFSIANTYLMPAPVHSFTPGGNGMVASLTSGATQVISWEGDKFNNAKIITVMGPGAVVDLPYSPEVSLRFGVIASAIVLGVTLLVIWINNFQKFRMRNIMERIRYGLPSERWGIALIVEVGVMLILWSIYLFSRMQLSELKKIDRISNEIRSVAASQGSLWVASHTGLWRLSEQGAIQEYEAVGDALPEGQIERLFKYNNELYLQMASGNYYQAQCSVLGCKWEKLSAEPLQPIIYQDSRWMWTHSGVAVQVQIKDQQGISHRLPLERARFDYLAVNDVLFSAGRFWIATNGGVAEYQAQIDGQVTLDRLYDEQDGLPASPVKSCLEAENTIICRAGGQDWRFETEQKRWARYSGPSPFEAVHEVVYNDALTGLYVQRMPQGVIFGPDAIIGGPISLYQRFSSDQAVTLAAKDDQIYIKTPVGVWQAEAEAGGALALRQFAISGLDAPFVTSPTVTIDPPGDFWRWSYRHNPQTGEDSVKITLASDGSVPRFLLGGGTFGDHFTEQIVLQSSERGTLAWLGTQQGIWRGTIATHSIDMVLENYYSVGGHSITSLWMEGEALYAQDENGQVFHYDPGPDNWSSADHLKPINYRSYELPIMGLLAIEGDPPYLPPVLFNNRYSFDRITDFAVSGDMLWTVTPDGVFAFQVSAEGLTARVKYQPAQGLYPSSARFIEIDEAGRPVILTDLLQYQRLEGVEFLPLNSVKDTPFDSNRLLISGAGMADWHSRDGRITAELNGVEVPFVQGKLAFDVVRDILPVRDEVWAVTEMGIGPLRFRYGAALVYEKAANETGLSSSITELDSEDEWVYGRLESGTFVRWDGNTWVELPASGISSGESLPFQTPVALYNQRQWQVVNRTYQDGIDRFEIQGLPKERIFDANGRLATDSVLAVGSNGNATWLVTPLGVQQFQTSPAQIEAEYLVDNQFGEYSILAGIVSEGKLYVQRQDGAIFQLRLEDSSHLQRIEGGQELFAPYRFVFKEGRWQQQMVEGNGLRTWLAVDGAKEDYSLFTSDGRFPFDVVHAVLPDGEGLWLGTEGGLAIAQIPTFGKPLVYRSLVGLPSSYSFAPVTWLDRRNGGIACQVQTVGGVNVKFRDCLNALPESTGAEILPELHLTLPRGREEITLKVESDTGLVFMQRGTAVRSIQHTDNRLEFLTDQDALTSPVFMLPNGERVWVLTSHALVMLNLAEIEKHIVP